MRKQREPTSNFPSSLNRLFLRHGGEKYGGRKDEEQKEEEREEEDIVSTGGNRVSLKICILRGKQVSVINSL